jgi:hypothetical protein
LAPLVGHDHPCSYWWFGRRIAVPGAVEALNGMGKS